MTRQRLAERLLMPLQTINDIIKGEVAISAEIAIRLESIFGTAAEFWISRETNYRAFMAVTQGLNELERIRKYEWAR
jgi:HTH-type transcriptional regulator/antitoxin HigA